VKFEDKLKQIPGSWYFLTLVIFAYILLLIFYQDIYLDSLSIFFELIYKIIPIFVLVFILMSLSNYFITPEFVIKHLREKGIKKWFFMVVGGILSSGPIYMWYPLLADLKKKGLKHGLIACFLYNRAIKIPLLPLAIIYFDWRYIFILTLVLVFFSIVQGVLIDKLMEVKK